MDRHIRLATVLTRLLDTKFHFGRFRFGFDPLLGVLPVIGDILPMVLSFYLVWIGIKMGIPDEDVGRMIRHIIYDTLFGMVPVVGDLGDFFYKANSKNLEILKKYQAEFGDGRFIN